MKKVNWKAITLRLAIYSAGICVFTYFYGHAKAVWGETWLMVGAAIVCIIALRIAGDYASNRCLWKKNEHS